MTLNPTEPPGHLSRKALRYTREIARLRREGYTCEAIRRALVDAGLTVSLSTVKREAARPLTSTPSLRAVESNAFVATARLPASPSLSRSPTAFVSDPRTSKEIAAAFVKGRTTNPLLRSRMTP